MIPKKIIDNSDVKLSTFLNNVLEEIPNTQFDIATAFFNIQAYAFIKDNLQGIKGFRLLLGTAPGEAIRVKSLYLALLGG